MIEKQLIKLLLNHELFNTARTRIVPSMFPKHIGSIYTVLETAHDKYKRDLTVAEVQALYFGENPAMPRATREEMHGLFDSIAEGRLEVGTDIAGDLLSRLWTRETARLVADRAIAITNGESQDLEGIREILEKGCGQSNTQSDIEPVSDDLDVLLDAKNTGANWHFNIKELDERITGMGPGNFIQIFARPETGKTAFTIGTVYGPGGFITQGATVHMFGNEEPMVRTMLRAASAATDLYFEQIQADPVAAKRLFGPFREKVKMYDDVTMSVERLDAHVRATRPDIVIVDNIDKLLIQGDYTSNHERLARLYILVRSIGKKYNCLVVGICQASAEAQDKSILTFDMMENSRTGKAAEGDVTIGIGKRATNTGEEDPTRYLNICKNKITGDHRMVLCRINNRLSRYED